MSLNKIELKVALDLIIVVAALVNEPSASEEIAPEDTVGGSLFYCLVLD